MEMGTGKTRTALEIVARRLEAGKLNRVLWLCPCSVIGNLKADMDKHCGEVPDFIRIAGIESLSGSERLYTDLMQWVTDKTMLIVDESNLVKNHAAIRTRRITTIAEACRYRMILNGTPISRNEADLFAQWYLLDWRILGYQSYWSFAANHLEYDEKNHGKIRRVLNIDYLTDKIAPYTYTIRKEECLTLPNKKFRRAYFYLTDEQRSHYDAMADAFLDTLVNDDSSEAIYRVFTALQDITSGRKIVSDARKPIMHEPFFDKPEDNPRIHELLTQIDGDTDQAIIWCKFQHELDDLTKLVPSSVMFCGEMSRTAREHAIDRFRSGDVQYFIANKNCAGYGLNLQFCHRAVYYDNDWDWATRAQSEDRIHRLGQTNDVDITDIYAERTIDKRILDCLDRKTSMVDTFKTSVKSKNRALWINGIDVGGDENDLSGTDAGTKTSDGVEIHQRAQRNYKRCRHKSA